MVFARGTASKQGARRWLLLLPTWLAGIFVALPGTPEVVEDCGVLHAASQLCPWMEHDDAPLW